MQSTSDFLKIIAGVALTILVIVFAFFIYNSLKDTGNRALSKASDTTNAMLESNITQYSRTNISGSEVVNAISTFMASSEEIYIEVITKSGSDITYIYPSKQVTDADRESVEDTNTKLTSAKQKGNADYISPKGKFTGTVVYDPDDSSIILGLLFEQN